MKLSRVISLLNRQDSPLKNLRKSGVNYSKFEHYLFFIVI